MSMTRSGHGLAARRLAVAAAIGVVAGVAAAVPLGFEFGPVVTWLVASALYLAWTWLAIGRMDAATTKRRATREDPTIGTSHLVLLLASMASLGGVALLILSSGRGQDLLAAALGALSVAASWVMVHTIYTLGYAAEYYSAPEGGIDFNQDEPPRYADFAYVGFTLGMTYQVSDTTIRDPTIRGMVLRQSLLSYVLGAVVIATTVNLVIAAISPP
jgi:uncharacterized membrane protein